MSLSETSFANEDSDTHDIEFNVGDRVVVARGDLNGVEGTVVAFRADARILLSLGHGVYIEVLRFCLKRVR